MYKRINGWMTNIKNQTKKNRKQQMKYKFICKKLHVCLSVYVTLFYVCKWKNEIAIKNP